MAEESTRRNFLYGAGFLAVGLAAPGRTLVGQEKGKAEEEEEVSPTEDLMREHGLLNRILLIYEETGRRLRAKAEFDPQALSSAAGIIRPGSVLMNARSSALSRVRSSGSRRSTTRRSVPRWPRPATRSPEANIDELSRMGGRHRCGRLRAMRHRRLTVT